MLERAKNEKYAIPAVDFTNFKMASILMKTANRMKSPLILAYLGFFLNMTRVDNLSEVVEFIRYQALKYDIPIALNLDHSKELEEIKAALDAGFTSVMYDGSSLSYNENVKNTKEVVKMANIYNVTVEGEIGHVGEGSNYNKGGYKDYLTKIDDAKRFVEETGVDTLAIAIGTAHGVYEGSAKLDFDRLRAIRNVLELPLVLHGGSGTGKDNLTKAVNNGIQKINIFTDLMNSKKEVLLNSQYKLEDMQYLEIEDEMEKAMINKFEEYIKICGSENKIVN